MALDTTLLCKTTGWHNNCGLNCLSHFLYGKLETDELQRAFAAHPGYIQLLKTFQEYYHLSPEPTWDEVHDLMRVYPNAVDREAILAPVLRKHLGEVLLKQSTAVWDTEAAAAISDYLKTGKTQDMAEPLVHPNLEYLQTLKAQYDRGVQRVKSQKSNEQEIALASRQLVTSLPPREITEQSLRSQIEFQRTNDLEDALKEEAQVYWMDEGMQRYATHIADLNQSVMVSADQLSLLGQALEIGVEVYTADSLLRAQNVSEGVFSWQLKVYNNANHWQYEEPNENPAKVKEHNQYYDEASLGEFKIFGSKEDNQEALIPAYISSQWEQMKAPKAVAPAPVQHPLPSMQEAETLKQKTALPQTVLPNVPHTTQVKPRAIQFGYELFSGLKNYIENKRTQLLDFRYHKLHQQSDIAMDHLLNKLQNAVRKGTINEVEKQVVFEFYFNALEEELKKGPDKQLNQRRVESMIKEVKKNDIVSIKRFALEEGKTAYDMRLERKINLADDATPSPTNKRRF